jgi:hypothetical protein
MSGNIINDAVPGLIHLGVPAGIYLTNGIINTNGFTVITGTTAPIFGGSASSYISGKLARRFNAVGTKIFLLE